MTREEIADALDVAAYTVQEPVGLARIADAVRALPVIATCGECGWYLPPTCGAVDGPARYVSDPASAPPSWCPLRGKR